MISRNCMKGLTSPITLAHAVIAGTGSRLAKTVENTLSAADSSLLDMYHDPNEFLEVITNVTGADADSNVLELYAARSINDDYTHVATLTYTTGTMVVRGTTRLYNDSLAVTEVDKAFEVVASSHAGNDMAKCWLNTNGYSRFLFIASTLGSTSIKVEASSVNRGSIPSVA